MADINIYGTFKSQTGDGKLAKAAEIYDDALGKFQSEINQEGGSSDAYETINIGEQSNYTGTYPDGQYTISYSGSSLYDTINNIWNQGKIPVLKVLLQYHTSGYSIPLYKAPDDGFDGHDRAENGNYTVDIIISSGGGVINTRSIGTYSKPSGGIPLSDLNGNVASGIVYDVSVNNSGATFASLSALLSSGSLSTLIPTDVRKGGMQIRFVQTSDNKYVQYRLMHPLDNASTAAADFANVANWQGVDDEPTDGSKNLIESGGIKYYVDRKFDGYEKTNLFVNSNNLWAISSTPSNYQGYIIPVVIGDVISAVWQSMNKATRYLVVDYPVLAGNAINEISDAVTTEETINVEIDGYFIVWFVYNNYNYKPISLILNGKNVFPETQDVRTLIEKEQEQIDDISETIGETQDAIDSLEDDVEEVQNDIIKLNGKIGDVKTVEDAKTLTWLSGGLYRAKVGEPIDISSSTAYNHAVISCIPEEKYKISIAKINSSANYPYNICFTNAEDVILEGDAPNSSSSYSGTLTVPASASKIYINNNINTTGQSISCIKLEIYPLQDQINDLEIPTVDNELSPTSENPVENKAITPVLLNSKMMSDHGIFSLESDWWYKDKYLEDTYATQESTALNAFTMKFRARAGSRKYQIAVISDTHGSGAYTWRDIIRSSPESCYRSIAVFNKVVGYCDAALHGGDLSCDYGTSRLRDLQYMYEVVRMFCFNKPFFITKGNHDENNKGYIEADVLNLDWANNTYYVRDFSTFTAITEATWDGSPLYVAKTELVSDREFRNIVQHWLSPSGAVWSNGAYYYYDIDSVKIRFVVANSFPVNDSHVVSEDEEYLWLAQTALNFSEKSNPQEWQTIMLRHTQSTSLTALSNCINAFRNGSTWTYGNTTVNFGEVNGGAMTFIAHIHGHEHQNCFSNGSGYFDIGENAAFVALSSLGDASTYGLSVWTIDTVNKKVYEDTIGGKTWVYDYESGRIEIGVGDSFTCARSGLSEISSVVSSDTSIATCAGSVVTGAGAGNATITVSDGSNTLEYLITVVAN